MSDIRNKVNDLRRATGTVDRDKNGCVPRGSESGAEDPGLVLDAAGPTVEPDLADECESSKKLLKTADVEVGASGRYSGMDA
jgi:hypothetical protein